VRAVVVCSHFPLPITSGGRKRTARLLEAMQRAGVRPHLLTHDAVAPDVPEARARDWTYEVIPTPPSMLGNRVRQHLRSEAVPHSAAMAQRLDELAPESAFIQLEEISSAQYVHAIAPEVPTVLSLYNVDSAVLRGGARLYRSGSTKWRTLYRAKRMERAEKRAVRQAEAVLAVSDHDGGRFAAWGARRPLLVANGVDDDLFDVPDRLPPEERVLFFGEFGWEPNRAGLQRYVDEAWPRVAEARPDAELRIAGPGSDKAASALAAGHPRIRVLGFVDDLLDELGRARLVLAPLWVGGGTRVKVLEALAAARPVVGTSIGVEQIGFRDECHGLVDDSPEGLARATIRLLADEEFAARCATNGRRLARGYRWASTTAPAEELYRELLGRRREITA
jgi:glycosyltransferase involved in cell wall biosynthesis